MTTVFNIRSTNGGGKSTLARAFLTGGERVNLDLYAAPTKKDPARALPYPGYYSHTLDVLTIGSYETACGGMDKHPAGKGFEVPINALRWALHHNDPIKPRSVICEGVLASGVYGSWAAFDDELQAQGHRLAFVYLHTPAEVCLERIRDRQRAAGKEPAAPGTPDHARMVENVTGKWMVTMATRTKALRDGRLVYDLPPGEPQAVVAEVMRRIVAGEGEAFRAK